MKKGDKSGATVQHARKNGTVCGSTQSGRLIRMLTLKVESIDEEMLTAAKSLKARRRTFHRWKNWAGQYGGKIRDENVKKCKVNGTCHPWKPTAESSSDFMNLQYLS